MVAELAREDFEDMRAAGLNPTLDDFDRLNQLALRLEDGPETTPANHPRIGWAGDVPFHEPTVAAIMWLGDYASRLGGNDDAGEAAFYFALAHGRSPEAFEALKSPRDIRKTVKKWLATLPCTVAEIDRACHYAVFGFDDAVAAPSKMKTERMRRSNRSAAAENAERLERIMAEAAAKTGLGYLELLAQTPSRLNAMVLAAQVEAGEEPTQDVAGAQVDYSCTLAAIRKRLAAEKAASCAEPEPREAAGGGNE